MELGRITLDAGVLGGGGDPDGDLLRCGAAQERGDEVTRRQSMTDPTGQPPLFTTGEEKKYNSLHDEGLLFNNLGIGLMAASAATAAVSAILFVLDNRAASAVEKHVRITPLVSPKGGGIAAQLEF